MVKRATNQIANLAMMIKKRTNSCQQPQKPKNNEKYFNYGKKRHYIWDCYQRTFKRKPKDEKTTKKAKQAQQKKNRVTEKAAAT